MQRITITLDDELVAALDRVIAACGYQNRSEAIRDLARAGIAQRQEHSEDDPDAAVAALVYVYDHLERGMAKRLTGSFHQHHDLSVASMHVHIDHVSCMEVAVLRGRCAISTASPPTSLPSAGCATDGSLLFRLNLKTKRMSTAPRPAGAICTSM